MPGALGPLVFERRQNPAHEILHRHGVHFERLATEARQMQQIINEALHAGGTGADIRQQIPTVRRNLAAVVVYEHGCKAVDCPQWRAQVVRHRVGK